jgi:hypothetical protein
MRSPVVPAGAPPPLLAPLRRRVTNGRSEHGLPLWVGRRRRPSWWTGLEGSSCMGQENWAGTVHRLFLGLSPSVRLPGACGYYSSVSVSQFGERTPRFVLSSCAPAAWGILRRQTEPWSCRKLYPARRRGRKRGRWRVLARNLGTMRKRIRGLHRRGCQRFIAPCSRRYASRSTECLHRQEPRENRFSPFAFPYVTCARADRRDRVGATGELHGGRWRLLPDLPRGVKSCFLYYICISCMPI